MSLSGLYTKLVVISERSVAASGFAVSSHRLGRLGGLRGGLSSVRSWPSSSSPLPEARPRRSRHARTVFTGYGFDACTAPIDECARRRGSPSPYRALGIYLGGVNRACKDGNLSASWVASDGRRWAGTCCRCTSGSRRRASARPGSRASRPCGDGLERRDVPRPTTPAGLASTFGLPTGSPIYFDMEGYAATTRTCTKAVQSFVTGWVTELTREATFAGRLRQRRLHDPRRRRRSAALDARRDLDRELERRRRRVRRPVRQDSLWTNHQRVHQYKGGHNETWGGVTINIDSNFVDGAVVGHARRRRRPRRRTARRLGRLGRRQGDRHVDGRFVPVDGGRDADADGAGPVAERLRGAVDGHRLDDLDADPALRRAGQPPPGRARERPRAVVLDRRDDLEAAAQAHDGRRRRLHAARRRDGRDRHARAGVLRPARRHRPAAQPPRRRRRPLRQGRHSG